ncbi:E2F transcription factor-like E2FE isoform X3 [Momordica charantia]|uniref:E2F transcription factor-like E2FE isoform X3 n=1 Tax=Momordica charantia TaxID=3673 RepID=A0A6J1C8T9_MOMCH|nr:E2F transcription factor-like E2FE isoform X3 [Momordica charantia]
MAAMPSSSALPDSSSSRHHTYSRKQKSLGLLCSNFLCLYNHDGVHSIGLDDAASRLGVERRRIYDIVNVLESVGVLSRKAKNQYSWNGFGAIPKALQDLKEEGLKENCSASDGNDYAKVSDDEDDDERFSNPTGSQNSTAAVPKSSSSLKTDNRREKSLALLTQNFVKLFICSHVNMISLDEAARLLLGDGHNSSIMRTKVRRLYDIANVLSSMNLIEKTHTTDTRKPAFRWLGVRGKVKNEPTVLPESRKRAFGTDVTNVSYKKTKAENSTTHESLTHCLNMQKQVQCENSSQEGSQNSQDQECERTSKSYQFGPFAPVTVAKVGISNNNVKRTHDWESLSSTFCPQYHNQGFWMQFL